MPDEEDDNIIGTVEVHIFDANDIVIIQGIDNNPMPCDAAVSILSAIATRLKLRKKSGKEPDNGRG